MLWYFPTVELFSSRFFSWRRVRCLSTRAVVKSTLGSVRRAVLALLLKYKMEKGCIHFLWVDKTVPEGKKSLSDKLLVPDYFLYSATYLGGSDLNSLTLMDRPMRVAMLQWGMVGVKSTETALLTLSTCKMMNDENLWWCLEVQQQQQPATAHTHKYLHGNCSWGKEYSQ